MNGRCIVLVRFQVRKPMDKNIYIENVCENNEKIFENYVANVTRLKLESEVVLTTILRTV